MSFIINRISNMSILPPNLLEGQSSELSLNIPGTQSRQQLFNLKTVPIKNSKNQSFHEKKVILLDAIINLTNIFAVGITILKNFKGKQEYNLQFYQNQTIQYRYLFVLSIFSALFNILKNLCLIDLHQEEEKYEQKSKSHLGFILKVAIQTIYYLIHPSYFTSETTVSFVHREIPLNKLLSCVVYLRLVTILFFFLKISRFFSLRVKRVLNLYVGDKKDFGVLYTIKCYLKENGLKSPFLLYGIIILILPFFIINLQQKFKSSGPKSFIEAIYDIIISMATIGYGDMKHTIIFQRMVFILVIVMGSICSSFFTLTFLNWFKLSQQEQKALRSIKRLTIKQQIEQLNNQKVQKFVHALVAFQKKKKQQKVINKQVQMDCNQNLIFKKENQGLNHFLPSLKNPQIKYLNRRLHDTRDTFKDFYQKNQIQLSQSIKILIQRTLLTNNLLQFYLMRQKSNKSNLFQNSLVADSSQTIKSRKRVDDNIKMYDLRLKIIKSTQNKQNQPKTTKLGKSQQM